MGGGFLNWTGPQTSVVLFFELSRPSFLSMGALRLQEHVQMLSGSMSTKWSLWLRGAHFTREDKLLDLYMRSTLFMPCLLRFRIGTGTEMEDIPGSIERCHGKETMPQWPSLSSFRLRMGVRSSRPLESWLNVHHSGCFPRGALFLGVYVCQLVLMPC